MRQLLLSTLVCLGTQSQAQQACFSHDQVVTRLADGYGEHLESYGVTPDGVLVEIYANPDTGTWTITITRAGSFTCLVSSGEGWVKINNDTQL